VKRHEIVAVWRYQANTRNYPGYHLTADAAGCTLLQERVATLARGIGRSAVLRLSPPTQRMLDIPNNHRGEAPCTYFAELHIEVAAAQLSISPDGRTCRLAATRADLRDLARGVDGIAQGRGDYCIGSGDQSLWFWWFPATKREF
jgi:hypothetical protein